MNIWHRISSKFNNFITDKRDTNITYRNIISLGYNCEIAFQVKRNFKNWPSNLFNWVYINDNIKLLMYLINPKPLFRGEYIFVPWFMYEDAEFNFFFHTKLDHNLFYSDNILDQKVVKEGAEELRSRSDYLAAKFFKEIKLNNNLYVIMLRSDVNHIKSNITLIEYIDKNILNKTDSDLFVVIEENNNIDRNCKFSGKVHWKRVKFFAPDEKALASDFQSWDLIFKNICLSNKEKS